MPVSIVHPDGTVKDAPPGVTRAVSADTRSGADRVPACVESAARAKLGFAENALNATKAIRVIRNSTMDVLRLAATQNLAGPRYKPPNQLVKVFTALRVIDSALTAILVLRTFHHLAAAGFDLMVDGSEQTIADNRVFRFRQQTRPFEGSRS